MNVYICLAASVILCRARDAPVTQSGADVSPSSYVKNTNDNFVEFIKKDLKRNNDDYKEVTTQSALSVSKSLVSFTAETAPFVLNNNHMKQLRRAHDRSYEYYDAPSKGNVNKKVMNFTDKIINKVAIKNTPKLQKLSPGLSFLPLGKNESLSENLNGNILPIKKPPSNVLLREKQAHRPNPIHNPNREKKMDKLKQFMEKNNIMFKEYMSRKLVPTTSNAYLRQITMTDINQNAFKKQKRKRMKSNALDGDSGTLPSPELLDMAPGRGGRIHKKRIEGRLCHRHVLLPEGPKYGRGGLQYLPAHSRELRRPFARTRPPELLLPRCCNCCRKSVLGCQ